MKVKGGLNKGFTYLNRPFSMHKLLKFMRFVL